jgi:hypothetical protein
VAAVTTKKPTQDPLTALMDALAERAETASDQEILDDAAASGIDVKAEASQVRDLLHDALLRAKKKRLRQAAEAHTKSVAELGARAARLPATPALQRDLLDRTVRRKPQTKQMVMTLQHRDYESLTDSDVESALRQLDALGLLDDGGDE